MGPAIKTLGADNHIATRKRRGNNQPRRKAANNAQAAVQGAQVGKAVEQAVQQDPNYVTDDEEEELNFPDQEVRHANSDAEAADGSMDVDYHSD